MTAPIKHRDAALADYCAEIDARLRRPTDPMWIGVRPVSPILQREVGIQAKVRMIRHVVLWGLGAWALVALIWFVPEWLS